MKLMDIKRQFEENRELYESSIIEVLRSGNYIGGEVVKKFEINFAKYMGSKYAISVGNGTDALTIALKALGIGVGDEVITTPFTFFATGEAIASVGATPVFVDVDFESYCLDVTLVEKVITDKTKAILPVHIYGHSVDMDPLLKIAKKYKLYIIEDCAQSAGTKYKNKNTGTIGDIGCFSFFPTKNLGAAGDGGMIITDNEDIYKACTSIKSHGSGIFGYETMRKLNFNNKINTEEIIISDNKYFNYLIGQNSRLDSIQAALLNAKLPMLNDFVIRRRKNAVFYQKCFNDTELKLPKELNYSFHSYYLYVIQHNLAKVIINKLIESNIQTGVYYPVPLHLQAAFLYLNYKIGDFPISELLANTTFAIPIYPELSTEDLNEVSSVVLNIMKELRGDSK